MFWHKINFDLQFASVVRSATRTRREIDGMTIAIESEGRQTTISPCGCTFRITMSSRMNSYNFFAGGMRKRKRKTRTKTRTRTRTRTTMEIVVIDVAMSATDARSAHVGRIAAKRMTKRTVTRTGSESERTARVALSRSSRRSRILAEESLHLQESIRK